MCNSAQPDALYLFVSSPSLFSDMGVQQPITAILILNLLLAARQLTWCTLCHTRGCGHTVNTVLGSLSNQQIVKHFSKEASVCTILPKRANSSQLLSQALASLPWGLAAKQHTSQPKGNCSCGLRSSISLAGSRKSGAQKNTS